jgi:hypothetical protein
MEVNKVKSTFHETTLIILLQVMVAPSHKHKTLSQVFLVLSRMHNPKKMTSARSQMKQKKKDRPLMLLAPTLMLPNLLNQLLLPKRMVLLMLDHSNIVNAGKFRCFE